jgi:surfeit locus 1 family protein
VLPEAPPPAGQVTVQGRLSLPSAAYLELQPETTSGPVRQNLDPARFAAATGLAVLPGVVEATAAPIPDDGLVRSWAAPDFGVDIHRIYMVQWYAVLAAALWLWFHRLAAGERRGRRPAPTPAARVTVAAAHGAGIRCC